MPGRGQPELALRALGHAPLPRSSAMRAASVTPSAGSYGNRGTRAPCSNADMLERAMLLTKAVDPQVVVFARDV